MKQREFIVTVAEERRYRVDYFLMATSEADARRKFDRGEAKITGEDAQFLSVIDGHITEVKENK